ncbi:MAG: hypothetical protein PSV17_05240 [Methylotenera sp.]|uniref:hypothetical protein n=1 Tax=Methylotenera sp. TaxID=2051956 RepID=UPI0024878FBA|nr:hypothetical protein [Methylotenera sp.]MDI1308826.1 hypothetical protein [Methylotenera sp.]
MIEALFKFPFTAVISLVQLAFNCSRLKLECGTSDEPNEDGVGNYIAFWIKIINPTKDSIYLERIEAKDSRGEIFFPMLMGENSVQEIQPQRNIVILIPCGHIVNTSPKVISVVDATEKYHNLKGKKLLKAVVKLKTEVARLKNLGFEVNPKTRWNKSVPSQKIA